MKDTDISHTPSAVAASSIVNIPQQSGPLIRNKPALIAHFLQGPILLVEYSLDLDKCVINVYLPLWHFIELFHHYTKTPVLCLSVLTLSFTPGRHRSFYVHTFLFSRISFGWNYPPSSTHRWASLT